MPPMTTSAKAKETRNYAERAPGIYRKFRGLPNGLGIVSSSALIPNLRVGSGITPGQPTEGIKIKPRDFR